MKNIVILGATGSIGTQTLDVIKQFPDTFNIVGIAIGKNIELTKEILSEFKSIKYLVVQNEEDVKKFDNYNLNVMFGEEGLLNLVTLQDVDYVVNAIIGFAGLKPTVAAIKAHKTIGLANKETLVTAGEIIMDLAKKENVEIIPIDSEHSAIFQALRGNEYSDINRLILTASGGAFRDKKRDELETVKLEDALKHPNWSMGVGITIDSATMFNKALEVIEAHYLFGVDYDHIEVLIHNESIDHSMVEFIDHSTMAQLSFPDMRIPIAYALSFPNRLPLNIEQDIMNISKMSFKKVDLQRFRALKIGYEVGRASQTYPTVLNASKEVANQLFCEGQIKFLDIETLVIESLKKHTPNPQPTIDDIINIDSYVREWLYDNWRNIL